MVKIFLSVVFLYAYVVNQGETTLEAVTKMIEKTSTVSGTDIRSVLYSLVDIAIESHSDSPIIRLVELGSLRVSIKSTGKETAGEVGSGSIKNAGVIFTTGSRLKQMQLFLAF